MNLLSSYSPAISKRSRFIVGVSGGCDSVALLSLLVDQWPEATGKLIVAHVNYGLRGKQSLEDEKWVRRLCAQWYLPLRVLRVRDFKKKMEKHKKSLQDYARELRYSFFLQLTQKEKAWGVAVAHHLNDQAETVLDHFLRGSGVKGLSGLHEIQTLKFSKKGPTLKVWRPLLQMTKDSLEAYLISKNITWREDLSNRKLDYRRNQIRHEVLPFLTRWNSRLSEVLARMGEVMATEDQYMDELLVETMKNIKNRWTVNAYWTEASLFNPIPLALKRRWVRRVVEKLVPEARGLSFDRVEEILRLWNGNEKGPRDIGYGLSAGMEGVSIYLKKTAVKKR